MKKILIIIVLLYCKSIVIGQTALPTRKIQRAPKVAVVNNVESTDAAKIAIVILDSLYNKHANGVIDFTQKNTRLAELEGLSHALKIKFDSVGTDKKKYADSINKLNVPGHSYIATIYGLGNISNSRSGSGITPSANIFADIFPLNKKEDLKISLGYNLGVNVDSTKIDSAQLSGLFFPDQSKSGFISRVGYNLIPLLCHQIDSIGGTDSGYQVKSMLEPYISYNYYKMNIQGKVSDSSKIETSTWLFGLNMSRQFSKGDNDFTISVSPYYKLTTITNGTFGLYKTIFQKSIDPAISPRTLRFLGVNSSLQLNKLLFSFIYEGLLNKELKNTAIWGGYFTLRATVTGDFFRF
jgi:hypothetical protein